MRVVFAAFLFLVPLFAGCTGGGSTALLGVFSYNSITRGDPDPVAVDDCADLLSTLNDRAEREATVALHQDYSGYGGWGWRGGPGILLEDAAMSAEADGGAAAPQAAPDVTGTNNQEVGVDEADLLKTDGTWTYILDGPILRITRSDGVGDLQAVASIPVEDSDNYWGGGQLLLEPRNPGAGDDRLVVITSSGGDVYLADVADSASFAPVQQTMSHIQVFDLGDRITPTVVEEHWIEGDVVGARLVDGTAYIAVYAWGDDLGLRTWTHPDDGELEERGINPDSYWQLSEERQKEIRLEIAEQAIADNKKIIDSLTLEDYLPVHMWGQGGDVSPVAIHDSACRRVLTTPDDTGRGTTTILSLGVDKTGVPDQVTQLLGGRPLLYGATDSLVLATSATDSWWFWAQPELEEATNLHWFDLDGLDVTHRASGRVLGTVQDQFGLDVHDGQLRVATTTGNWGRWWVDAPEPRLNHIALFDSLAGQLVPAGLVGGIAPGERIWSARFTDDRAYIVTFEQIDPLWIIDLTGPGAPRILGELEIPGVSTYIHPLSDDALLTIGLGPNPDGLGPNPDGLGLDWSRMQVSLFDISDPTNPTRAAVLDLTPGQGQNGDGWSWSNSAALHEHKAFTYWDRLGKLAIPVATHQSDRVWVADGGGSPDDEEGGEGGYWDHRTRDHIGLHLIDVDPVAMTLTHGGEVDQDHLLRDGTAYPRYLGAEIQRSYFLGFPDTFPTDPVSVYSLSGLGLTAHDLETLAPQDAVAFTQ